MRSSITVPLLLMLGALSASCGVNFHASKQGNEFFKSAKVSGDMHAGSPLSGNVSFVQNYPTEVTVTCELRQGKNKVKDIGHDTTPPLPDGTPEKTPFPANFSWTFTVDSPGDYKFECFTPADEDNFIIDDFHIGPALATQPAKLPVPTAE